MRQLLQHHDLLPRRDDDLARFEQWLAQRLEDTTDPDTRRLVERFGTWHHLRRIRARSRDGQPTHGSVHTAKQELTETGRFLDYLRARGQTLSTCSKADLDEWLTTGPTTRTLIRTFIVWARRNRLCHAALDVAHRTARSSPLMTQDQRLGLIRQCLTGETETVAYRLAGLLLLLYAQPVTRICQLRTTDVLVSPTAMFLQLGDKPAIVPEPFADLIRTHLANRPNMRTGNTVGSPWLFPSRRPGEHLHASTVMERLRANGIHLLGSRNAALRQLVRDVPAPLLADQLGYSPQITHRHAALAAETMAVYGSIRARRAPH
ncbi:MAG: hypothetical protein JWM93_1077 [Frankiales bacterium]|nr:hypothetical protein [Frankiales bacterium]